MIRETMKESEKVYQTRAKQKSEIEAKLDKLEERLINEEIDSNTFKKWRVKLFQQLGVLDEELNNLRTGSLQVKWNRLSKVLPRMNNLRSFFDSASPQSRQKLLRVGFDGNLIYSGGRYRTKNVHPALQSNALKAKKIGLIEIDEPLTCSGKIPSCTPDGS
ncbi:hypothetical protein [Chitinophaga terrae (ex Kim and Jung 2007)]|uniref:hypothetical protein n=2 Tax=Chitinophaga terrae (ex Kim and Jung 2007) TaxID=408074 RepID=UPI001113DFBA|nr:hypothetical protein [Chitinophaga terrae (ex Kim and Jung 2007)]